MQDKQARIEELFTNWFNGTLSASERAELEAFAHEDQFDDVLPGLLKKQWQEFKATDDFTIEQRQLLGKKITAQYPPVTHEQRGVYFLKTTWLRYAAAIILLLSAITFYYTFNDKSQPGNKVVQNVPPPVSRDILPGSNRAILTLSNGQQVELNNATSETIKDGILSIKNNDGQLSYKDAGIVAINTMSTPAGGQYKLTLSDGTKVWLNAASSITYPTAFTGKTREVSVSGEAYFEVAKNQQQPFIVKAGEDAITVLGTSFNVNYYPGESRHKTSLADGAIKVNNNILQPGEAYSKGKITKTDIAQDISWKNGVFDFENMNIQEAMNRLARWYNLEIIYKDGKIPGIRFGGKMDMGLKLSQVLEALKESGLQFKIEAENKLIITQ